MNAQDCLQILRDVKDAAFATVDEKGVPQVRIIDVMLAGDEKIYFCTARGKDFYAQLMQNNHIAVTAVNRDFQMVRLTGTAEKLKDQKDWIDRIFQKNPSMNSVYPKESRYILEPFCIADANIEFFDLSQEPIYRENFVIGNRKEQKKGFEISVSCIGCGTCERICPQQCISCGTPYEIHQNHCLHCGLCFENCPVKAVKRRGE